MGSFTEITLAMTFAADTPPEIVGAFERWRTGSDGPPLPTLEESLGRDDLEDLAEDIEESLFSDPQSVAGLPLLHLAVGWRSLLEWGPNAYFPGTPGAVLSRDFNQWRLTLRALPKSDAASLVPLLARLGEHAADGTPDQPWLAGYLYDEQEPQPMLVWSTGGAPFRIDWVQAPGA